MGREEGYGHVATTLLQVGQGFEMLLYVSHKSVLSEICSFTTFRPPSALTSVKINSLFMHFSSWHSTTSEGKNLKKKLIGLV